MPFREHDRDMDPMKQLQDMLNGFRISAAISVAADLGLSDLLQGGPRTTADLAQATDTNVPTLRRLLRALVAVGVYAEQSDGTFASTPLGDCLRDDLRGTLRPFARSITDPANWSAWGHLEHSVTTGENAFQALHGVDVWTHRQGDAEGNAIFNAYMTSVSTTVAGAVAGTCDFSRHSSVVDVGGGKGILLETVLARHPHLTGTVFDLAHVVAEGPSAQAAPDVAARFATAAGNFFESVPPADVYLLKSILHDWPDDRCQDILRTCRRSLNPDGVVLVIETLLGRPGFEAEAALSDLNMLVLPGGRERTQEEYGSLFQAAGLRFTRSIDTDTRFSILEASAAD
jgi:O-methyltransferase/methyltransferase family protein